MHDELFQYPDAERRGIVYRRTAGCELFACKVFAGKVCGPAAGRDGKVQRDDEPAKKQRAHHIFYRGFHDLLLV